MTEPSVSSRPLKASVADDVNAEIAAQATQAPPAEARRIEEVAGTYRKHAVDDALESESRTRGAARVSQFIDYAFFLVYALLGIRFLLSLIAAKSSAGFVRFIVTITDPLYAPFRNIVSSPKTGDGHTLLLPIAVALGAYLMLHLAINRLLRLVAVRQTEI